MKNKITHNKAKSLHIVQEIPNSKSCYIGRIPQKSMLKSVLTPLPLAQLPQIQVPAPLSGRVLARKVVKPQSLKTQPNFQPNNEINEMKQQQSIFQLVASAEFKNIITEEKSKKEDDNRFTLEGPLLFKIFKKEKVFSNRPNFELSFTQQEDTMNMQIFLKKIRQIMTTSHISHEENHTNENSFLSDKFKTQMTNPRFTFTNHLSTIQFQNQQTQLQKAGTIVSQVLDAIEEKKEEQQPEIRKKLTITVCSPDNQVGFLTFSVPDYGQSPVTEYVREYGDKPKHVLKQALQFISSQPKRVTTKFSKSILKIVGISEEENHQEDVHQFYNLQKTRRFMKMYLQNKMSRVFSKLEESILLHLQLITEKRGSISYSKPSESVYSSRLYSSCTNPANSNHESYSNPAYQVEIDHNRFLQSQTLVNYTLDLSEDCDSSLDISTSQEMIQCSSNLRIINLSQYIHFVVSGLEDNSRNVMLQELDQMIDTNLLIDQFDRNRDNQIQRNVNHWVQFLKRKDKISCAKTIFLYYNDIVTGVFEDEHEINDLTTDYGIIEVEDEQPQQPSKIDIAKMFIKAAAKPIKHKHSKSNQDQSPSTERSHQKTRGIISQSPRHQTINQTTNTSKPNKQLLEATSSQTSVLRRRSDSPQEETSIKENSNTNTTQSNKMKNTQTVQNTTAPVSQKDVTKPEQQKIPERRNAVVISSMSKHALQMRTQITEARRRQSIPVLEIVKLLIEEQKLTELEELFTNNPNIPVNERLKGGDTYLIIAAQTGCQEIVELLLHKGAQVNLQNDLGDTALHKAIVYNFYNVADLLISQGAQNLRNKEGLTPWQLVH